uniref:Holin n=1 Tax=viral metagenome TaxID=1070528 RepID=A0A6M3L083_9ZZZZ
MSFLTTIKSIFSTSTSIDKAVEVGEKIADGVIAGLDKIWLTEEEKADNKQKATETVLAFWKVVATENTEQSKARRQLAVMTFKVYFSLLLIGVTLYKFDANYAKFVFDVAGTLTWLVSGIAAIFFGPHQLSKIIEKK